MDIQTALLDVAKLVKTVAPIMLIGLLTSNFLFSLPQFRFILKPIEKLSRFANLKSGVAISAFLLHPIVGISMLSQMYKNRLIDFRETVIAVVISILPRGIRAMVLFLAPVSISILGFELGLKFITLEITSKLIVVAVGVLIGKALLSGDDSKQIEEYECKGFRIKETIKVFLRTIVIMSVSAFFVSILLNSDFVSSYLSFIPKEMLMIILSGIASTTAGISVAGSLLAKGVIDGKTALFAIFVSRFFHIFIESMRMSMPIYTSFFGFRIGIRLLVVHIVCRCLSIAIAIFILVIIVYFI